MIGVGAADTVPQESVEAFETAGCAQVLALPGWVAFLQAEVGDGGAEVAAEGGHGFGLAGAVLLHDAQGAVQDGAALLGLEDGDEVAEDGAALAFTYGRWQVVRHVNGAPDVAKFVKEAALFGSVEMNGIQGSAQATTAIVNDQFQAVFTAQALLLELAQEGQPAFEIFTVGQLPGQHFLATAFRPDAQGDQQAAFAPAFDGTAAAFAVGTPLARGTQLRKPDGIQLQNGWGAAFVSAWGEVLELMQALEQGALPQYPDVAVRQLTLHGAQAHAEGAPALNLGVDIAVDALVGPQPVSQVQRNAAAACANETWPAQRHRTPARQEAARSTPVATEALALYGSTLGAGACLFDAVGHMASTHVRRSAQHVFRGGTQPHTDLLANLDHQTAMGVLDGPFDEGTAVDMTSFG